MKSNFTGHPLTIGGNPLLLDQLEIHLKPFCNYMFMKFINYEDIAIEDLGMVGYIADNTIREIAANISAMAVDWKNEYSIEIYNRAWQYNKQQLISKAK